MTTEPGLTGTFNKTNPKVDFVDLDECGTIGMYLTSDVDENGADLGLDVQHLAVRASDGETLYVYPHVPMSFRVVRSVPGGTKLEDACAPEVVPVKRVSAPVTASGRAVTKKGSASYPNVKLEANGSWMIAFSTDTSVRISPAGNVVTYTNRQVHQKPARADASPDKSIMFGANFDEASAYGVTVRLSGDKVLKVFMSGHREVKRALPRCDREIQTAGEEPALSSQSRATRPVPSFRPVV